MNADNREGTRILHFPDRRDAESFVHQEGFQYLGAPGRWQKTADGAVLKADIHISGHGAVVVIYAPPGLRPTPSTK